MSRNRCNYWNVNYITFQWFTIGLFSKYAKNVNISNYFNSIDVDIIKPDAHAFSQRHVMDIATKPVEHCNIVGSTLGIT